jgi:hypothetical protein
MGFCVNVTVASLPRQADMYPTSGVWLRAKRPGDRGSIPGRGESIFTLTSVSRPALGPTQPLVQWVPGVLSPGVKRDRGVTLTTHPHLLPRSWMSWSYTFSPPCASIGVAWNRFFSSVSTKDFAEMAINYTEQWKTLHSYNFEKQTQWKTIKYFHLLNFYR